MHLQAFLKGIDSLSEWSGRIFIWIVVPLTVVVAFEVIYNNDIYLCGRAVIKIL